MKEPLWQPTEARKKAANITRFIEQVNKRYGKNLKDYWQLYDWSVENISDFWAAVWDFTGIISSRKYDTPLVHKGHMLDAKWFPGARLNFAENLLRYRDNRTAFIFKGETKKSSKMTYTELYTLVARLASSLRQLGVKPGDRVAGYMPNMIETVAAMLATTSLGAVWSSCATDIGADAAVDRLGQIEPLVLFTVDGYFYKEKPFDSLTNVEKIVKGIPSIKKVVITGYRQDVPEVSRIPNSVSFAQFAAEGKDTEIKFEQVPFDHPLLIMFSSGTTGKPKCMVQSVGGILINHLKELVIMSDLKREDVIFYITTCSWMMWNWLMSSLAAGATIVLFDGNALYPDEYAMWKLAQEEKVTIFGLSATYVNYLKSCSAKPGEKFDLSSIKEISQTGSALSAEGFKWVYDNIKKDVHFNSIAGGTDINGCFVIGSPIQNVYAGETQGPGLGMKIKCYDEKGKEIWDQMGELVCEAPAPSMPIYYWNDPKREKYMNAYYNVFPNIWRHGDWVIFDKETRGVSFIGRSDAVLKPSGVRIGTAEIYNQVEKLPEIADSLAIGQDWQGDQRVILFVKMKPGNNLDDALKAKIVKTLRENASPRHVPSKIITVKDIPYTLNMKKVETAVTNLIHGRPVLNRDALMNPECLDLYKDLPELRS